MSTPVKPEVLEIVPDDAADVVGPSQSGKAKKTKPTRQRKPYARRSTKRKAQGDPRPDEPRSDACDAVLIGRFKDILEQKSKGRVQPVSIPTPTPMNLASDDKYPYPPHLDHIPPPPSAFAVLPPKDQTQTAQHLGGTFVVALGNVLDKLLKTDGSIADKFTNDDALKAAVGQEISILTGLLDNKKKIALLAAGNTGTGFLEHKMKKRKRGPEEPMATQEKEHEFPLPPTEQAPQQHQETQAAQEEGESGGYRG